MIESFSAFFGNRLISAALPDSSFFFAGIELPRSFDAPAAIENENIEKIKGCGEAFFTVAETFSFQFFPRRVIQKVCDTCEQQHSRFSGIVF